MKNGDLSISTPETAIFLQDFFIFFEEPLSGRFFGLGDGLLMLGQYTNCLAHHEPEKAMFIVNSMAIRLDMVRWYLGRGNASKSMTCLTNSGGSIPICRWTTFHH